MSIGKIPTIKSLREFCANHDLTAGLKDCKDFVDKYYHNVFVDMLRAEINMVELNIDNVEPYREILALQAKINSQIYLTGSRFFGNAKPDSDYDFFVQQSWEVEQAMAVRGFMQMRNMRPYLDTNCYAVWQYNTIHVQLSYDVDARLRARNKIKAGIADLTGMNKINRSVVWNELMR